MIYLELSGGLGNQLFEYAMARRVLEVVRKTKPHEKITIILSRYNKDPLRNYSLDSFCIEDNIRSIPKWKQKALALFFKVKKHYVMRLCTDTAPLISGKKSFEIMMKHGLLCTTDVFNYYPYELKKRNSWYIYGNFQSLKYFDDIIPIIKKELVLRPGVTNTAKELCHNIQNCNSVSLHIRRGDYLDSSWGPKLNICSESYYNSAIEYVIEHIENPIFYVFSNSSEDIRWIKENMKLKGYVVYIDQSGSEIDDFYLMSMCKHHIISNSTYSWWSSFLSDNPKKIVLAPDEWYLTPDQNPKDVYINTWVIVNTGLAGGKS